MGRYNIVVVGLHFGRYMLESNMIEGPGAAFFKVTGVCDLNAALTAEVAQKYGVRAYTSLDEVLADPDVPAVALFVGPAGRAKLVEKVIRAGKDVMTTKPFELDPEAGLAVLHLAKNLGRIVHLNSPNPLLPADLSQMNQWQAEYKLGRPIAAHFQVWCSYREKADNSWYDDWERCPVAPVFRLGIYALNDIVYFLGEPESVQVTHSRIFTGRPTPDNGLLSIRFKNGALASVFASFCIGGDFPYANTMTLNFAKGSVFR
ncbi:MAG: Gfo/Idh/MocA family oxidoreductase, partial [Phycisphaerae bacterium]